jgi:hypothetical protein
MSEIQDARTEPFECAACGQKVRPVLPAGEKGEQRATCSSCGAIYTRTYAFFQGEWVFGLWRNAATGKVACSYYKTAFGANSADC